LNPEKGPQGEKPPKGFFVGAQEKMWGLFWGKKAFFSLAGETPGFSPGETTGVVFFCPPLSERSGTPPLGGRTYPRLLLCGGVCSPPSW